MNLLREHTGYLTKCSLDSFSGIRDQKVLPKFMRLLGVAFSGDHQFYTFCRAAYLLIVGISIRTIAIYSAISYVDTSKDSELKEREGLTTSTNTTNQKRRFIPEKNRASGSSAVQ